MHAPTIDRVETRRSADVRGETPLAALTLLYAGAALTVLAMIALAVDVASTGLLAEHLHDVYDGHVEPPSEGVVAGYLFTVGIIGLGGWLWTAAAVRRRRRSARPVATVLFVLGATVAVSHLTVSEYGETILPTEYGIASLVPSVAGLVAVIALWKR